MTVSSKGFGNHRWQGESKLLSDDIKSPGSSYLYDLEFNSISLQWFMGFTDDTGGRALSGFYGWYSVKQLLMLLMNRNHRGLRHYWGLRVRGQHTKTTGRRGKTVGVSKKRWAWRPPSRDILLWYPVLFII